MKSILDLTANEVIYAPTEEIAIQLTNKFHELGLTWSAGSSYLKLRNWNTYKEETCYKVNKGGYANRAYFKAKNYTILTIDQLTDFNTEKNNQMQTKTTKAKLLSIWGQNGCSDFNKVIKAILIEQVVTPETTEFVVGDEYLKRLPECNADQLKLLKSVGIEKKKEGWSRDANPRINDYYFLDRNTGGKLPFKVGKGTNAQAKAVTVYRTEEIANQEARIFNLMMLMRNWARYHNQMDNFKANWEDNKSFKHGIVVSWDTTKTLTKTSTNAFLFGIAVSSSNRAVEMMREFKKEIEEIIPLL